MVPEVPNLHYRPYGTPAGGAASRAVVSTVGAGAPPAPEPNHVDRSGNRAGRGRAGSGALVSGEPTPSTPAPVSVDPNTGFPVGARPGVLVAHPPKPVQHHHSVVGSITGWLVVAAVVFMAVKFVKGQRNKAKASAEALSASMASLVAAVNASSAANAVAAGGDSRSAVALNIGGIGQPGTIDRDQLASDVAAHVLALLRAGLPDIDDDDGRPDHVDYRRTAELPSGNGPRSDFDAYGDVGRRVSAGAAARRASHREPAQVTP